MLASHDLDELLSYRPAEPVLSVYLDLDPSLPSGDVHKLTLRNLMKPFQDEAPANVEAVAGYFEHGFDGSGRSLVVFSCAQDEFFRAYSLAVPVRSRARLLDRPYVKPLADLLGAYGHYGVALIDQQQVRLFHFHLGEVQEEHGLEGDPVRHAKIGGGSQAAGRRGGLTRQKGTPAEVADRNLREAAQEAARFFDSHHVRRVLVGGTEENVARFLAELPKVWQSLVVGTFAMEMTASPRQILARAMELGRQAQVARLERLVETIVTAAAKGGEGVIRLDDTLEAVSGGRVQTLVVSEGYRAAGYRCRGCGYLTIQTVGQCPFCGETFEQIDDAVELAIGRVMKDSGEVEILRDNKTLQGAGGIGALLRY